MYWGFVLVVKKSNPKEKLLTEVELELMQILWSLEEGAVSEVQEALPEKRKLAYTSISTILRILEQKGVLKSRKEGRGHIYVPILSKTQYEQTSLRHIVSRVFDGTPTALVKRLLEDPHLSEEDLQSIRSLLEGKRP